MKLDILKKAIGITWGYSPITKEDECWFHVQWMDKAHRYWGYHSHWYDGPLKDLGLWWINFSWRR